MEHALITASLLTSSIATLRVCVEGAHAAERWRLPRPLTPVTSAIHMGQRRACDCAHERRNQARWACAFAFGCSTSAPLEQLELGDVIRCGGQSLTDLYG
jgi:hypothetical protein